MTATVETLTAALLRAGRSERCITLPDHEVIVLDIESGEERGSVYTGSHFPNGMFLTPGFGHDLYCSSNGFVSRLFVA